jgi:hypothetical protein
MGRLRKQAYFIKVILLSNGQDGLCMGGVHKGCLGWLQMKPTNPNTVANEAEH